MKKIIVLSALIFCFSGLLNAQTRVFDKQVVREEDSVKVSFKVDAQKGVPTRHNEVIMPYIHNGGDTLWFESLEIFGKERYMKERQERYLAGEKDWELQGNQVLGGGVVEYVSRVRVKRWMKSADIGFQRYLTGCNCRKESSEDTLRSGAELFVEPVMPERRLPEYVLEDATRRWDFGQDELEIIFKVSKAEIDSSVFNNEVTFGKILSAVDKIFSNPHFRIDKIDIAGYASPEGSRKFNNWLGENRAKALIDYIILHRPQYGLTPGHFNIHNGEENWAGLRRHLLESRIEEKDTVAAIIDSPLPDEEKKAAIKAIDGGKVWKKMLEQVYPHLRCARYLAVFYDSTDDHAVEHINQANALIRNGKPAEAYVLLSKAGDDMRAFNSIGVSLMMQGRFEEAMPWLEKALEGNCPSAQKNIDAIKAEWEYEALRRKEIEEYLNKYN